MNSNPYICLDLKFVKKVSNPIFFSILSDF